MNIEKAGKPHLVEISKSRITEFARTQTSEWNFVVLTIIFVLVVTTLPYLYAYGSTPADKQFMGIMVNVPDHVQYFSWMRELTDSHLSANKLTPEPNRPVFFNLLWWGMGRLGQLLGLGYAAMFQILRLVATTLFLLLIYRICSWFLEDPLQRRIAFLTAVFGSGFGWLLVVIKYLLNLPDVPQSLLLYVSEPNTFFNILAFPHFIAAVLYTFVFDLILRGEAKNQLRYAIVAGVVALFLGWQHAYDLVLVYGILGSYALLVLLRDRRPPMYLIKAGLILGFISCSPAFYSVLLTSLDPVWKEVLAQFDNAGVFTPNPLLLPILLGPALLIALFTLIKEGPFRLQGQNNNTLFLKAWFWANFLLLYIPTDYQIHMLNGWQLPIAILASMGLFYYIIPAIQQFAARHSWSWSKEALGRAVLITFILLIIPTNIYLILWRFIDLRRHEYPYYLHQTELAAMDWLETNAKKNDVILSSLTIGQYIPSETGMFVFLAHWAQTVDYYNKESMVNEFFNPQVSNDRRQAILHQYSVDYIFYGPVERALGQYNLADSPLLQKVQTVDNVDIYQVRNQ
jgi:hypothetical protein